MIAALYVETGGCYFGLPGVVVVGHGEDHANGSTTVHLDGRKWRGGMPVVAHPSCKRFGRFWHGSTRKPHQFKLGDDGGCFEHALEMVRQDGGVIEHPCDSKAWTLFNLNPPPREGGWVPADLLGGWTCCVDQGHYGHFANKLTWLYVFGVDPADLPDLIWGKGEQRLHPKALEKYGYAKARRIGMMAMVGGKDKVRIRNRTPVPFRDLLIGLARSAKSKIMGTVPTKEQAEADDAGGVANSLGETLGRLGSHPGAPILQSLAAWPPTPPPETPHASRK